MGLRITLLLLTLIGFGLRLRLLDSFPFREDEAIYSYWALHGWYEDPLFLTVWPDKPPLFLWMLGAAYRLFGVEPASARWVNIAASTLTIPVIALIARRLWGPRAALIAAVAMALSPFAISFAPTAYVDPVLVLIGTLALACAVLKRPLAAGLFLGAAMMTKQQGVLYVPLVVAVLLVGEERRMKSEDRRSKNKDRWTMSRPFLDTTPPPDLCSSIFDLCIWLFIGLALIILPIMVWDSLRWAVAPSPWDLSIRNYVALTLLAPDLWLERWRAWVPLLWYLTASRAMWILIALVGLVALVRFGVHGPQEEAIGKGLTLPGRSRRPGGPSPPGGEGRVASGQEAKQGEAERGSIAARRWARLRILGEAGLPMPVRPGIPPMVGGLGGRLLLTIRPVGPFASFCTRQMSERGLILPVRLRRLGAPSPPGGEGREASGQEAKQGEAERPYIAAKRWDWVAIILAGWVAGFLLLHIVSNVPVWDRYLLPLAPLLALLAGWLGARIVPLRSHVIGQAAAIALVLLLALPAWQAANGALMIGGDHGAYSGLEEAAAWLDMEADNAVLFHDTLGWHFRYYLYTPIQQGKLELRWFPSSTYLADNAEKTPHLRKFYVRPDWAATRDLAQRLRMRGLTMTAVATFGRVAVYEVTAPEVASCDWCLCGGERPAMRWQVVYLDVPTTFSSPATQRLPRDP